MRKEIEDLLKHETWELEERSSVKKKITSSKWVYTLKYKRDMTIDRFKSRFVVRGFSQVHGQDYTHSFSATMRSTSFRILMAIAAGNKLKLDHFDVTNAFTQSEIDEEIYVEPPLGFTTIGKDGKPETQGRVGLEGSGVDKGEAAKRKFRRDWHRGEIESETCGQRRCELGAGRGNCGHWDRGETRRTRGHY